MDRVRAVRGERRACSLGEDAGLPARPSVGDRGALPARRRTAHAGAPHPIPHLNSSASSFALGRTYASRFRQPFPYNSLPFPFFADSFDPDDIYSTGYPVAS